MNADTTPMNPSSFSVASVAAYVRREQKEEPHDLADIFRLYGRVCFRNGFVAGFVTGVCAVVFVVAKKA